VLIFQANIYGQLWWCRKVFTLLGGGVWAWVAYNYRDLNRINNQLLVDIQKQNADLKHLLQGDGCFVTRNKLQTHT